MRNEELVFEFRCLDYVGDSHPEKYRFVPAANHSHVYTGYQSYKLELALDDFPSMSPR